MDSNENYFADADKYKDFDWLVQYHLKMIRRRCPHSLYTFYIFLL